MTAEMLAKARATAAHVELDHVEFREGLAEAMPVATCEGKARSFDVYGYASLALRPSTT
jgi:hypothetical protein